MTYADLETINFNQKTFQNKPHQSQPKQNKQKNTTHQTHPKPTITSKQNKVLLMLIKSNHKTSPKHAKTPQNNTTKHKTVQKHHQKKTKNTKPQNTSPPTSEQHHLLFLLRATVHRPAQATAGACAGRLARRSSSCRWWRNGKVRDTERDTLWAPVLQCF